MNELRAARKWIATTLAASSDVTDLVSTRIYAGLAPQGAALPYVVYSLNGGTDIEAAGADRRVLSRLRFTIRAVTQGESFVAADAIAEAVDAALVGNGSAVSLGDDDYQVIDCGRESPVEFVEDVDGTHYRHSGGIYRVQLHQLP